MIAYSATLDVPEQTATLLVELLAAERLRRGTGVGARAASCWDQAVLVLRWFREDTGMPTLARDAGISPATGYRYLHEGITEVFSPGFAVRRRRGEASLQVRPLCQRSVECRLPEPAPRARARSR